MLEAMGIKKSKEEQCSFGKSIIVGTPSWLLIKQ